MPPQPCGSRTAPRVVEAPTPYSRRGFTPIVIFRVVSSTPVNVDAKGIFQIQQLRAVLAPLAGDNGPHVEVIVESGGGQVALGVDAV